MGEPETNKSPGKGSKTTVTKVGGRSRVLYARVAGLVVALLVIVGLVVGGTWYITHRNKHNSGSQSNSTANKPKTVTAYVLKGDTKGAIQLLDQQIASATTNAEKATLYDQESSLYITDKDYGDSLKVAQKAESLDPTEATAAHVGDAASAQGEKALAIKYYKLQIQRVGHFSNQDTYNRIQAKITALGGTN